MDPHKRVRIFTIIFSLIASLLILALKFYAAHLSNSQALRSDALEGIVNVLAAAFGLGALLFSELPADEDHPYGHGKIEYFAKAFEGGLISLAAALIAIDAIGAWIHPEPLRELNQGLILNLIAGALNGVLGFFILRQGKRYHSEILKSDGLHLITDLWTTLALAAGMSLVLLTGIQKIDYVLAMIVSVMMFRTGFQLVREASGALLDAQDPELLKTIISKLIEKDRMPIIQIHDLKSQRFGRDAHVDLHMVVPETMSVKESHEIADLLALELQQKLGPESMIHTHIDPCDRYYCTQCPLEPCPIREQPFKARKAWTSESLTKSAPH